MFVAGFPHALQGGGELLRRSTEAGLDADFVAGTLMGWHFGSLAMFTLGAIVITSRIRLLKGYPTPVFPSMLAGGMYDAFGIWGLIARGVVVHFFGFIGIGIMVASIAASRRSPNG